MRKVFFTEPQYDGYAAVLVRLPVIDVDLLTDVLTAAWRCRASKRLLADVTARHNAAADRHSRPRYAFRTISFSARFFALSESTIRPVCST